MANFCETLAVDELENVVRYLSTRPNRPDWYGFIAPHVLENVISSDSLLARTAVALFTSVTDGKYSHYDHCGVWPLCNCLSITSARTAFVADHFPRVMKYCGSTATHIAFSREQDLTRASAEAVVMHASAMESLSVYSTFAVTELDMILQKRGKQLRRIHANCIRTEIANTIAEHCTSLQKLHLIDGLNNLPRVLQAVGSTLTAIELRNSITAETATLIQTHCPNIHELRLWCVPQNYEALVNLCRHYGAQLEFAWLHHFSASQCGRVLEMCPNVRVEMDVLNDTVDTLRILAQHAQNLSISFEQPVDKSQLAASLAQCTHMKSLHLYGMDEADDDILLKLFDSPNSTQLRDLSFQHNIEVRSKEIAAIAAATGQLRTLKTTVDCLELQPRALKVLVARNPHLEQVKILLLNLDPFEKSDEENAEYPGGAHMANHVDEDDDELLVPDENGDEFLSELVGVFARANALRELVVVPYPYVRSCWDYLWCVEEACLKFGLRARRIHVSVLNVDYLPAMEVEYEGNEEWQELQYEHDGSSYGNDDYDDDDHPFWPVNY